MNEGIWLRSITVLETARGWRGPSLSCQIWLRQLYRQHQDRLKEHSPRGEVYLEIATLTNYKLERIIYILTHLFGCRTWCYVIDTK